MAARDTASNVPLSSMMLQIKWNGVLIEDWRASDWEIHTLTHKLKPRYGLNTLEFRVIDKSPVTACFDNVSLKRSNG